MWFSCKKNNNSTMCVTVIANTVQIESSFLETAVDKNNPTAGSSQ